MALGTNWVVKGDAEKTIKNFVKGMAEYLGRDWFQTHSAVQFAAWLEREMPLKGFAAVDDVVEVRMYIRKHPDELYGLAIEEVNKSKKL